VCLHMGQSQQVVLLLQELLKSQAPAALQQRACQTLAAAYLSQKDFPAAAEALSRVNSRTEAAGQ